MKAHLAWTAIVGTALLALAAPSAAWDRGVRARGALRAADRLYNKHAYREAMEKYRQFMAERATGAPAEVARAFAQVGECGEKAGHYREALQARASALAIYLESNDKAGVAETLRRMGETQAYLGNYDESLRILGLSRLVPGETADAKRQAAAYRSLAVTYGALGRYKEQGEAAQASLAVSQKAGDAEGEAAALNVLAVHHQTQGRFDEALDAAAKALAAAKRSKFPDLAPIYLTTAAIHRARGNIREALRTDEEALEEAKKGGVVEAIAVAQANLGLDAMAFGEYAKAREYLEEALGRFQSSGATDDTARMRLELGRASYFEQNYPAAMAHLAEARRLFEASKQPVAVAVTDAARGRVLEAQGKAAESLEAHDRALAAFRAAGETAGIASESVERGFALADLGRPAEAFDAFGAGEAAGGEADLGWRAEQGRARVAASRGDVAGALASYRKAAERVESLLARARVPEFRSSFLGGGDRLAVYDEAIDLLSRHGRAPEALEFAERSRARAFLDLMSAARVDLRTGADAELLTRERALKQQILDLSQKASRQPLAAPTGRIRAAGDTVDAQLLEARNAYHDLLQRIAEQSPGVASLVSVKPAGVRELQAALGSGEQALLYHVGARAAHIFVVSRSSVSEMPVATAPRELRALAAVFRIQLEQRIPCEKMARTLHRLLLAPVEGRLGPGPVLVAAHDMLHYVPFQALMDARGKYLLQKRAVRYVPSLSALAELARRPVAVSGKLLAVGSPAAGPSVPPLPKATEEVQRVSSYFKGATVFTGAAATEAAVKREIASAGTLHFACHGLLEADLPLYSGLVFAPGAGEDGRLELHEIFGLKLAAGLTVLSACQTALGSLSRGDELVCLARAFLYAGSQSVVASLWSVPDESTVVLMDRFYAAIGKGETRESALRAAALCLLADPKYREPYFWSAFSLFGKK